MIDETGLDGIYNFDLQWTPDLAASPPGGTPVSAEGSSPSIFTALQEQVGLRLEAAKGPVEMFVVDQIERPSDDSAEETNVPRSPVREQVNRHFAVASVKLNRSGLPPTGPKPDSNVPLGPQDAFSPTGGLLSAINYPLLQYLLFAFRLTPKQYASVQSQLPKWASSDRFDIQARAEGNPTKDQYRLMMQTLLADRFKLAVHYETREVPIFSLVLDKPGKLGPQLQPHSENPPCAEANQPPSQSSPTLASKGLPEGCGAFVVEYSQNPSGRIHIGARNMSMDMIATPFTNALLTGIDRPVADKTGLSGKFDFSVEFSPETNRLEEPNSTFQPDPLGPTFLQALKEQLGLKLESDKGPVDILVIDHVEQPSEN